MHMLSPSRPEKKHERRNYVKENKSFGFFSVPANEHEWELMCAESRAEWDENRVKIFLAARLIELNRAAIIGMLHGKLIFNNVLGERSWESHGGRGWRSTVKCQTSATVQKNQQRGESLVQFANANLPFDDDEERGSWWENVWVLQQKRQTLVVRCAFWIGDQINFYLSFKILVDFWNYN